jgi:LmbE family N-acetylglucosaminyl deacetylase
MKKRRKRELRAAAKVLGIRSIHLLSIPDGTVARHINTLVLAVRAEVRKYQPDCIVSFGPCGITGHRDHIAAGVTARRVARQYNLPFAAMTLSIRLQHLARKFLISRRRSPHYTQNFSFLNPNTSFAINPKIKHQAIRCHASQMDGSKAFTGFPNYVVEGLLRREYFNVWKK